jgi:hypothetical protein
VQFVDLFDFEIRQIHCPQLLPYFARSVGGAQGSDEVALKNGGSVLRMLGDEAPDRLVIRWAEEVYNKHRRSRLGRSHGSRPKG